MQLLIVKLAGAAHHGVALSLVSGQDTAELVESVEDAVALLGLRTFDLVILVSGPGPRSADATLTRLRELAPLLAVVLLIPWAERGRSVARPDASRNDAIAVDVTRGKLTVGSHQVPLSQAEFRLFAKLWSHRGQTVSAVQLLDAIYVDSERPGSRVLPVFLFKLRRKLARFGLGDLVQTAIGRGFMIPASDPAFVAEPKLR